MAENRTASLPTGTWVPRVVDKHWLYATTDNHEPVCLAHLPGADKIVFHNREIRLLGAPVPTIIPTTPNWRTNDLHAFAVACDLQLQRYKERHATPVPHVH